MPSGREGVSSAVPELVGCLLNALSVPLVEVNVAACDLISILSRSKQGLALSAAENMVRLLFVISL
jgi:hypothetical protein